MLSIAEVAGVAFLEAGCSVRHKREREVVNSLEALGWVKS